MAPSTRRTPLLLALLLVLAACGSTSQNRAPNAAGNPSFVVASIQESLDVLGYDVGPIDGIPGERSIEALTDFQRDQGLEATGKLDGATTLALARASDDSQTYVVEAVQTQLAELGYLTSVVDGQFGPETEAALTDFHAEEGIEEAGVISGETLTRLTEVYIEDVVEPTLEANGYEPPEPADSELNENFLRQGDERPEVLELQQRLLTLGYRPGEPDGRFGANTTSAVLAFQKHEGLDRDGVVGPAVEDALDSPLGVGPRSTVGPRIEVDLDRQIAFVVDSSSTITIINISSGSGRDYTEADGSSSVAYTPTGEFVVERVIDGVREAPLGSLYRPLYFKQGWAMHGSPNVPAYPASHGCVRASNYDQDFVFPTVGVDDPIIIYGTSLGEPSAGSPGF